jgi:hypothetical protein
MRRAKTVILLAGVATMAALLFAPAAGAAYGDNFGFADVNTGLPGDPNAPAYPGETAVWAGTCDLSSASTSAGGVGTAPSIRAHCIDSGASSWGSGPEYGGPASDSPWPTGEEPTWRLDPVTQAGAHPDASAAFFFNYKATGNQVEGTVKTTIVKLPPGVVGNPEALPHCPAIAAQSVPPSCVAKEQAGIASIGFPINLGGPGGLVTEASDFQTRPVYNMEARDTVTAEFMISCIACYLSVPVTARGRTNSDYGVDTLALLIPDYVPIGGNLFTFWGVPWAKEHDKFRINGRRLYPEYSADGKSILDQGEDYQGFRIHTGFQAKYQVSYDPSWGPIKPFFTNPTECSGEPLPLTIEVDSWQHPVTEGNSYVTKTVPTDTLTGCDKLNFDPAITLHPDVNVADSPSGLDVELSIPQNNDPPASVATNPAEGTPDSAPDYWKTPAGLGAAHLKDTTIHLPQGTSFNPAAADGLQGCTTAQIGLTSAGPPVTFNNDPVQCPNSSKIGTLEIVSPLLSSPLFGAVYVAPQNDNPFPGTLTAIYLVSQDEERGLSIKLAGRVDLDPDTGQISTTFVDNPQLPFDHFRLHFETGPRAALNTPATCGNFENAADLIPWSFPDSGPQPTIHDPFPISAMPNGLPCVTEPEDRSFRPGFEAGSTSTKAASFTDFVLNVTRRDGEQEISGVSLDMAPGVTGNLSQTPYCPEAAIAAARTKTGLEETNGPSCPAASYIGKVDTLAGAGSLPLPTTGRLYLSGPYDADGAGPKPQSPLSVTTVVPAIAGGTTGNPAFDLGNVVIRTGINLDSQTAQVHIDSTDVPYIVGGVPLRIRSIAVKLDKPNFMLNGTNCEELKVGGSIRGAADPLDKTDDVFSAVSNRFQVDGCKDMGFKPKLTLKVKGGTKRNDYQQLTATLTPRPGDANLKSISVALPHSEFLAQNHINTVCTRVQFAAKACPEGSVYGFAKATTPLLKDPLEGPVYLRSSSNPLPDMVLGLRGQVDLDVVGRVDSVNGGLRNSFEVTPDAPVSQFTLTLKGGKKSLLVNSRDICFKTKVTTKRVNGKLVKTRKLIPTTPKATVSYVAQNGIELTQKVALQSAGCAKKQAAAKAKRKG